METRRERKRGEEKKNKRVEEETNRKERRTETFRGNLCDSETNVGLIKGNSKRFLVKAARRLQRKGRSNGSV